MSMDIEEIKRAYGELKGSRLVEVWYRNKFGNREIRPGYLGEIFDQERIDWLRDDAIRTGADSLQSHPTEPYVELNQTLDKSGVPQDPIDLEAEQVDQILSLVIKRPQSS